MCDRGKERRSVSYTHLDVYKRQPIDHQHLEDTEDLSVHLLTFEEVKQLLENNEIMQSLNAAPLWKYVAVSYYHW